MSKLKAPVLLESVIEWSYGFDGMPLALRPQWACHKYEALFPRITHVCFSIATLSKHSEGKRDSLLAKMLHADLPEFGS